MIYTICGFLFGCLIPYLARHISRLLPATTGYVLLKIFIPTHYMPWQKLKENQKYMHLLARYFMRSVGWGIFTAAMTFLFAQVFDSVFIKYYIAFLWILLLLVEIDKRAMLLPDILTLPLLILGFAYATQSGTWLALPEVGFISITENSVLGAIFGYAMPIVASMFIVWKHPEAFGGGDIKLLCAIGAWVGFEIISYILLLACIIFGFTCLINRLRVGPFGPAIVYATIIAVLFFFGI